jgi:cell division GTPase FtsZ
VYSESIDPHAKVIFGAIRDEKLKKNEVKVTVIATGFPEADGSSPTTIVRTPLSRPVQSPVVEQEEDSRGRIFNSLGMPRRKEDEEPKREMEKPVTVAPVKSEIKNDPKPVDPIDDDNDEDWGAVPAFLRRSKLK